MIYVFVILSVLFLIAIGYIMLLHREIRSLNTILKKRLHKNTNQLLSLDLFDRELTELAMNMNQCFKAEETLRLKVVHDEVQFKDLIANISHDLRTPLTAIQGYLQLLEKSELTIDQQDKLRIVRSRSEELGELIQQFFEYAYLLDHAPEMECSRVNLTNIVTECFAAAVPFMEQHGLTVELFEQPVYIYADKGITTRIIENLVRNIMSHAKEKVIVTCEEKESICLHMSNNVESIEDIDILRLFDRFYVGHMNQKTTGLGLSIVKILVEQMGGQVSASAKQDWIDLQIQFLKAT